MNLQQLEGISDELDLIYSLFAEEMLQSMHSSDYIVMTINPQYNDSTSNMRVTEGLSSFCENQSIISNAFFYATFSEMVYSSSRTVMELNAFPRRDVSHRYMEQEDLPGIYYQREKSWRLFSYTPTQVYLITEMTTPVLVSLMFCQLDLQGLQDLILARVNLPDSEISVYNEEGNGILVQAGTPENVNPMSLQSADEEGMFGDYYYFVSEETGWIFLKPMGNMMGSAQVPFLIRTLPLILVVYILFSIAAALYISRNVYRPIRYLMKMAGSTSAIDSGNQNEIDYLNLVWSRSHEEREAQKRIMKEVSDDVVKQLLRDLIENRLDSNARIEDTLNKIDMLELIQGNYIVIIFSMVPPSDRTPNSVEMALYSRSIEQMLLRKEEAPYRIYPLTLRENALLGVISCDRSVSIARMGSYCDDIIAFIQTQVKDLPFGLIISKGRICQGLVYLTYSYQEALRDIQYQLQGSSEQENEGKTTEEIIYRARYYFREKIHRIMNEAGKGNRSEAEAQLALVCDEIRQQDYGRKELLELHEIAENEVTERMISRGVSSKELGQFMDKYDFKELEEKEDLEKQMEEYLLAAIRLISRDSRKRRYAHVEDAQSYISEHYQNPDLSLQEVSEYVGITSSYMSVLFAEVTGKRFSEYLSSYRVSMAKEKMKHADLSITQISVECGFNSAQNFSRVFKKLEGSSPIQYREGVKNREKE